MLLCNIGTNINNIFDAKIIKNTCISLCNLDANKLENTRDAHYEDPNTRESSLSS
jgi:hypothetical protein